MDNNEMEKLKMQGQAVMTKIDGLREQKIGVAFHKPSYVVEMIALQLKQYESIMDSLMSHDLDMEKELLETMVTITELLNHLNEFGMQAVEAVKIKRQLPSNASTIMSILAGLAGEQSEEEKPTVQ